MNKRAVLILLYFLIVGTSVYIVVRWYIYLKDAAEKPFLQYLVLAFFVIFTFLNFRRLINLIKNYKK